MHSSPALRQKCCSHREPAKERGCSGYRISLRTQMASNEIEPEVVDDLARAAAELTLWDVQILDDVLHCESTFGDAFRNICSCGGKSIGAHTSSRVSVQHLGEPLNGIMVQLQSFGFAYGSEGDIPGRQAPFLCCIGLARRGERFLLCFSRALRESWKSSIRFYGMRHR